MRALIITDVHGNHEALQAVLATPEAHSCDRIYSLGDQVNFGPQPREVMTELRKLDAICLLGNHEARVLRHEAPEFQGYNWNLLHWTADQVKGVSLDFPVDLHLGSILFTHATPGDPWHLVFDEDLPAVLNALPDSVRYLISGHNHKRWQLRHGGRTALNPGSLGLMEDAPGRRAPFAVLDVCGDDVQMTEHTVTYDLNRVALAYLQNGSAEAAPELTRAVFHTMETGSLLYVLLLMRHAAAIAKELGLSMGDPAVWLKADATFDWKEPITSKAYWQRMERDLHD